MNSDHFSTGQYDQFQQRINRIPNGTTMGATDYHGKPAIWTTGMNIMHVTDDGQLYPGTVKSIADGLLEITWPDGESGWEQPATCYPG